jgi:hypothetical protein
VASLCEPIKVPSTRSVWELRYVVGSAASVSLLGVSYLLTFVLTDPLRLLSFSTTLANLVDISGRVSSNPTLAHARYDRVTFHDSDKLAGRYFAVAGFTD